VFKDTQAQNLLRECISLTLKTALKIEQKNVKHEYCQYLGIGWKYRKILKISLSGATFRCSTRNDYWF